MALYGNDEYKKTQAEQSWQNYNQWSTEMDERFERDQANARVRSGASGGTSGALEMQLARITGEYEKERANLDAGESKKYLDDYFEDRGSSLQNEIYKQNSRQFGRDQEPNTSRAGRDETVQNLQTELAELGNTSQEDFYQSLFGENETADETELTETESANMRAKTAASGRQAGGTPWLN